MGLVGVECCMIVSVSRRCDIPRFQFPWFMERIRAGSCKVANPFNRNQIKQVSLIPQKEGMKSEEGVSVLVFWTRDPRKILENVDELIERGFNFYVMVTVTGYPVLLEPSMTRTSKVLNAMKKLAEKIGPDRVIWRYDPVFLTNVTNEDFHLANFNTIAQSLAGSVKRVIISIYDEYKSPKKRLEVMEKFDLLLLLDTADILPRLLTNFAKSAEAAGMNIQSCARKEDFSPYGIKPGACIDAELIHKLWGLEFSGKDKNQRPNCLCCKSVDIGAYGICGANCIYCYAWH